MNADKDICEAAEPAQKMLEESNSDVLLQSAFIWCVSETSLVS
jgi:hypothetical protein